MAQKLSKNLVAMFTKMFANKSATERYLSQSTDLCDLEMRMKRLHLTSGKIGL
jgi:DNA-binding MltR family transcriptional regulator